MPEIALLGPRAAVDLFVTLAGIDSGRALAFANREGLTGANIVRDAFTAIGAANEYIVNRWSGLLYQTTKIDVKYRGGTGTARKTPVATEFVQPDGVRSSRTGHMLPMRKYDDSLGWTPDWLKDAQQADVDGDIQEIVDSWRNRVENDIFWRILTKTETAEGSGWSTGWAVGTGINVPYIPPANGSKVFDSTHTHYVWTDGSTAAKFQETLFKAAQEIRHHGYKGKLVAIVSASNTETYMGMAKFVSLQPGSVTIVPGNGAASVQYVQGEAEGLPGDVFGYVNSPYGLIELRAEDQVPAGYGFMYKSFGANNPQNPLALRLHPGEMFGMKPDVILKPSLTPVMQSLNFEAWHGMGINNRTAAVAFFTGTGATEYPEPTSLAG